MTQQLVSSRKLGVTVDDIVYFGDSHGRDMISAIECGIFLIHVAENVRFNIFGTPVNINTVGKLIYGCTCSNRRQQR